MSIVIFSAQMSCCALMQVAFSQDNRVTDHRLKTNYELTSFLNGDIESAVQVSFKPFHFVTLLPGSGWVVKIRCFHSSRNDVFEIQSKPKLLSESKPSLAIWD